MAPLGKFTLSVIGLRLFGAAGFFWGMFLGHLLIDHSLVGKWIENRLSELDDNVRLLLPYGFYKYYSRLDDNLFGKVWGALLGAAAFGWGGFITLFILGHILFDVRGNALVKDAKKGFEHFWNRHWGKIFGFILGFSLHSRIVLFAGIIIGFFADLYRLEGTWRSKLKINRLLGFWARINPLKLALHSAEARKVSLIQSMAGLSAKVAKADGQVSENEIRAFKKIFDITAGSNDKLARIFNEAKQTADNFEPYAFQLRLLAKDDLNLQESIVENLFKIAVADGRFGDAELGIIRSVATIIELPDGNFEAIRQNFEIRTQASSLNDCYQVLGVFCNASNCEIKRRWKELINQYHPDRAQANGADRGTIETYTLKMAEINNAYQNIMKSRKTI